MAVHAATPAQGFEATRGARASNAATSGRLFFEALGLGFGQFGIGFGQLWQLGNSVLVLDREHVLGELLASTASSSISSSPMPATPSASATPNRFDSSSIALLRLVDLDMLLHAADQRILQPVDLHGVVGDLAQRDDRVLVVVAVERQRRAGGDLARPLRRDQYQLEPVRHLDHAIFDSDSRHPATSPPAIWICSIYGGGRGSATPAPAAITLESADCIRGL
jgi:hypothetical protein